MRRRTFLRGLLATAVAIATASVVSPLLQAQRGADLRVYDRILREVYLPSITAALLRPGWPR